MVSLVLVKDNVIGCRDEDGNKERLCQRISEEFRQKQPCDNNLGNGKEHEGKEHARIV